MKTADKGRKRRGGVAQRGPAPAGLFRRLATCAAKFHHGTSPFSIRFVFDLFSLLKKDPSNALIALSLP
jgi:hypothetical protein